MHNATRYLLITSALLMVVCSCGGRGKAKNNASTRPTTAVVTENRSEATTPKSVKPVEYTYRVVKTYPHSEDSYTQGLLWHEGYLYEGTGGNGTSRLMKVELETGKAIKSTALEAKHFGEGIVMHNGKIIYLTWESGKAFVYDAGSFRLLNTFSYDGEGWGITTDGEKLYMSNGSDKIYVRNADTFAVERVISVTQERRPVNLLNELEWIDGEIWANVYLYSEIVRIDPATGNVTGVVDFSGLQSPADIKPSTDVFNGIAYDAQGGRIFVTGKNWNKLYQVDITAK